MNSVKRVVIKHCNNGLIVVLEDETTMLGKKDNCRICEILNVPKRTNHRQLISRVGRLKFVNEKFSYDWIDTIKK